jgi:hypothetical protein
MHRTILLVSTATLVAAQSTQKLTGLQVRGNMLVDKVSGLAVVLRGVSHSSTEYACVQGHGIFEGPLNQSFVDGLKTWKNLNVVRCVRALSLSCALTVAPIAISSCF